VSSSFLGWTDSIRRGALKRGNEKRGTKWAKCERLENAKLENMGRKVQHWKTRDLKIRSKDMANVEGLNERTQKSSPPKFVVSLNS